MMLATATLHDFRARGYGRAWARTRHSGRGGARCDEEHRGYEWQRKALEAKCESNRHHKHRAAGLEHLQEADVEVEICRIPQRERGGRAKA